MAKGGGGMSGGGGGGGGSAYGPGMDVGPGGSGVYMPSAPLPSAPPSYEEAVGLTAPGVNMPQPPSNPGYPTGPPSMPMPMPMPMPTSQMPMPMPQPAVHVTQPRATSSHQQQQTGAAGSANPTVRVIHQHVSLALGPNPIKMSCPSCHADIKTTTMSDHQPSAHVCCIILCLLGCCLCSCLPYCLSSFLSVHHFCPNCKAYIGTWKG